MASQNDSFINLTMKLDLEMNSVCNDPANHNLTICNKRALGINLSTPILMLSAGVIGNVLALALLYTSKKEVRKTVFFTLLAGLAWTDLLGQVAVGPIAIITYANNLQWQGGEALCKYHGFMMVCLAVLTPLLVLVMSIERVLALRFSYFYARVITVKKARVCVVLCWATIVFFCTFPFMGLGSYELQFPGSWCFLNFHRESSTDAVYAYLFATTNILIIALIVVCNTVVVITLLQMRKSRRLNNSPSIEKRLRVDGGRHRNRNILQMEMETQMVWFLGAITLVFCTCYLPLNVHILINQITGRNDIKQDLIGVRLASINQILDPWLYILLKKAMFLRFLKRLKRFVASSIGQNAHDRYPGNSSSRSRSLSAYQLQSVITGGHSGTHQCLDDDVIVQSEQNITGTSMEPITTPDDSREVILNAGSDSESDAFVEPQIKKRPIFISVDAYINSCMTRRQSSGSGDVNGNKTLRRMYSLPAYLKGEDNAAVNIE